MEKKPKLESIEIILQDKCAEALIKLKELKIESEDYTRCLQNYTLTVSMLGQLNKIKTQNQTNKEKGE